MRTRDRRRGRPGRPGDAVLVTGARTGLGPRDRAGARRGRASACSPRSASADSRDGGRAGRRASAASPLESLQLDLTDRGIDHGRGAAGRRDGRRPLRAGQQRRDRPARLPRGLLRRGDPRRCSRPTCSARSRSPRRCCRTMRAAGCGRIVTISSVGGRVVRLGRDDVLRDQVRPGGARRGTGAGAGAVRDPVDPGRAGDHQDRPLARHRGTAAGAERSRRARTTSCSGPARRSPTRSSSGRPTRPEDVAADDPRGADRRATRLRYVVGRGARS